MPLGLPDKVEGFLFDMDGVLTRTASLHAAAWKQAFDEFLQHRDGNGFEPFDAKDDYDRYVDGRSRLDGTRGFLESRHVDLPDGSEDDDPGQPTVNGVANRKNQLLLEKIERDGVEVFEDTISYVRAVAAAEWPRAVVSASANTAQVLASAGIADLFDAVVDGVVAKDQKLRGKPAPDMFLTGAEMLGLRPDRAAVFEDALAGVQAGRTGHFAVVVGVDRVGQADELRAHGADVVVTDVSSLLDGPGAPPPVGGPAAPPPDHPGPKPDGHVGGGTG